MKKKDFLKNEDKFIKQWGIAEKVYDYVRTQENQGYRLTANKGGFDDINDYHRNIFLEIVKLVRKEIENA